jgi:hypothetical protein
MAKLDPDQGLNHYTAHFFAKTYESYTVIKAVFLPINKQYRCPGSQNLNDSFGSISLKKGLGSPS